MPLQIQIVRDSFAAIQAREETFADAFYAELFVRYPDIRLLFARTSTEDQKKNIVRALAIVVDHVDDPDTLLDALTKLGKGFTGNGLQPRHRRAFEVCLLSALAKTLGTLWTPLLEEAWLGLYQTAADLMQRGAYTESRLLQCRLVRDSFEAVRPHGKKFADTFYRELFDRNPAFKPMFADTSMEDQADKVVLALSLVVNNLERPNHIANMLGKLGKAHAGYGVKIEHYRDFELSLLATFADTLGTLWTLQLEQAWSGACRMVTTLMQQDAGYAERAGTQTTPGTPALVA